LSSFYARFLNQPPLPNEIRRGPPAPRLLVPSTDVCLDSFEVFAFR
jgi:hypothetical protein